MQRLINRVVLLCVLTFGTLLIATEIQAQTAEAVKLVLNAEEQLWIRRHPQIRIQMSDNYPPFEFRQGDTWQGLGYDYLLKACQRLGINVVVTGLSWSDALQTIGSRSKQVDLLLSATQSPERAELLELTKPYLVFPQVIITNKQGRFVSGIKDLELNSVVVEKDYLMVKWLKRDLPSAKILEAENTEAALNKVATGQADAYVGNLAVASYLIEQKGLANLKVAAPTDYGNDALCIGVRKDWPELAGLLDKAMASLTPEEHRNLRQKWLSVRYEHGIQPKDVAIWLSIAVGIALALIVPMRTMIKQKTGELAKQKKLLDAIMENTYQYQGLLSPDGVLLNANKSALAAIAKTKESIVGKFFWDTPCWLQNTDEQNRLREAVARCRNGETVRYEMTNQMADGTVRAIDFSLKPLQLTSGKVSYLIAEGRDISEIKKRESAIKESEHTLQLYIQRLPVACIMWGTDYRVQRWNPAAEQVFGYSESEALGRTANELIVPETARPQVDLVWSRLKAGDPNAPSINENVTRDGRTILCQWTNTPFFDNEKNVTGIISVAQDITERQMARDLMMQSEKMTMIAGMAAGMAHEVNNPLGIIAQDLQNLERRFSPSLPANRKVSDELGLDLDLVQEYMERRDITTFVSNMRTAVKRASTIISNMLQFSHQGDGSHQLYNLNDVIAESIKLASSDYDLRKKYDFKNISITREFASDLPLVSLSITEIEQVMINLLKNGAQAMFDAGIGNPAFFLRTYRHNGYVVAEFRDNGPGMSEDVRSRVFDPFFSTKEVGAGTGLGLSVSYSIVTQNHGGLLLADSKPGQGACFTIKLPVGNTCENKE